MTPSLQFALELRVVLDDSVVNESYASVTAGMGMGVFLRHASMGRPSSVGDAHEATEFLPCQGRLELVHGAHGLDDLQGAAVHGDYPGRIISSVFEPLESLKQYRRGFLPSDEADNPAH